MIPRNEYPRPQFVRSQWMNLNGEWDFNFDDENIGLKGKWYENFIGDKKIVVPFAYQTKLSGINDASFHDIVWYRRKFTIPQQWKGKDILLNFGAVDYRAWVFVNGQLTMFHEGGNTTFSIDITDFLLADTENELVLRVEDPSEDTTIPRGKQYWHEKSQSIFYTRTTGIWQTVWIEPVDKCRIKSVRWTPDIDNGDIILEFDVNSIFEGLELQVEISFKGKKLVNDKIMIYEAYNKRVYNIRNRFVERSNIHDSGWYWTPETPNLFDVALSLYRGSDVADSVATYFGMRKVSVRYGKFHLNNFPYYQRLVLDQGYFPESLLTAPTGEALKEDILLAKEMGFNGARKHQKVEDPIYLYWADTLGFIIWGEMANCVEYSEESVERITKEWIEAVNRDYNHPSIVVWVPINESWGVSRIAHEKKQQHHSLSLYYLTKAIDDTRLVISNDGWEHTKSDLCTIHNYKGPEELACAYATLEKAINATPANRLIYAEGYKYGGEPILITEFGGIAYRVGEEGWGYSAVTNAEALIESYEAVTMAIKNNPLLHGYCYTQLTDVEQEINGLLTYNRKPKCDLKRIQMINLK